MPWGDDAMDERLHGTRIALSWFPFLSVVSPCSDKFGYLSSQAVRTASALPFNPVNLALLAQLGNMMGDAGRDPIPPTIPPLPDSLNSPIPAGYTYFGQFVDHDITLDVSSSLDAATDANTINNMRSPALDLDSLYGSGPGLDPFMYVFPTGSLPDYAWHQVGCTNWRGCPWMALLLLFLKLTCRLLETYLSCA